VLDVLEGIGAKKAELLERM
jgi:hypothetical protein